jgi:hypothetical protein
LPKQTERKEPAIKNNREAKEQEVITEIGRILISLALLTVAGGLLYVGLKFPEPAQALGAGTLAGTIIGAELTYWLRPSA